jgi:hypothetical protein
VLGILYETMNGEVVTATGVSDGRAR